MQCHTSEKYILWKIQLNYNCLTLLVFVGGFFFYFTKNAPYCDLFKFQSTYVCTYVYHIIFQRWLDIGWNNSGENSYTNYQLKSRQFMKKFIWSMTKQSLSFINECFHIAKFSWLFMSTNFLFVIAKSAILHFVPSEIDSQKFCWISDITPQPLYVHIHLLEANHF